MFNVQVVALCVYGAAYRKVPAPSTRGAFCILRLGIFEVLKSSHFWQNTAVACDVAHAVLGMGI